MCILVVGRHLSSTGWGVLFHRVIDWSKISTITPLMKGVEEDLYWRVCRMMTKDGNSKKPRSGGHISPLFPQLFPPYLPIPNILCGLKE